MLANKLALITGGGSGIGKSICKVFAELGATVVATDVHKNKVRDTVHHLKDPSRHRAVHCDVTGAEFVNQLHEYVLTEFGRPVDILINSAGVIMDKKLLSLSEHSWDWVINTNLKGTFLMTQAFTRSMKEHKIHGSVINISSIIAKTGNIGQSNYAASKAGVLGFTKSAARELGPFNIRVNAVMPGFIVTPMTEKVSEQIREEVILPQIPLGRLGSPEEVAKFICVLACNEYSSYITGACIEVTGGFAM